MGHVKRVLVLCSMKKIICLILSIMVVIGILITIFVFPKSDKENNYLINSNAITLMIETDVGSGEYKVSNDRLWPQEGYIFNEMLSYCENGSSLNWNDETRGLSINVDVSEKCYVYFDKYLSVQITNVVASNITSNSITINVSATSGTNQISKYYYSINNGSSYIESSNSNYTFTGLEKGTKYNIKVYAVDTKNYSSNIYSLSVTTDNAVLLADYIINEVYESDGVNGLYYHDGVGTYTNANQEAGDNSYRYSGADPNNYVCFGSDADTCPDEYLYRIIGVFDEDSDGEYNVKLIKADYTTSDMLGTDGRDYYGNYTSTTSNYKGSMNTSTIATYRWNYDTSESSYGLNNWTTSELNKINLNTNYLNYLGSSWNSMIEDLTWHLGGMTSSDNTAKSFYTGERNNAGYGSNPTTYGPENANGNSTKIGLMYPSDYGYAAFSNAWATNLSSYNSSTLRQNNWLYMGLYEWTITPNSIGSYYVFNLSNSCPLNDVGSSRYGYSVRPVFYLNANVIYISGTGTENDPYRIN